MSVTQQDWWKKHSNKLQVGRRSGAWQLDQKDYTYMNAKNGKRMEFNMMRKLTVFLATLLLG